jgi:hypothetical protein
MRSIVALGVVSLAVAAGMAACGDDSSDDRPSLGGSGGTSGGGSGGGGTGGGGAGGTGGGTGGTSAGTGGTGGAGAVAPTANCTGCVQLTVPVGGTLPTGATNYQAGYVFTAAATAAPFDLSDVTTITWRVQALTTNAMYYVQPFLQTAPPEDANYSFGVYPGNVALTAAAFAPGAWVDVSVDVGAIGGGADAGVPDAGAEGDAGVVLSAFDKAYTRTIGLMVGALAGSAAGFVSVEVDSVTVVGTSNFTTKTFAANVEGLSLNMYQTPTGTVAPTFH